MCINSDDDDDDDDDDYLMNNLCWKLNAPYSSILFYYWPKCMSKYPT
jgi:hypothetical protein